ncbi:hypothetical protein MMC24_003734 [Lignoscripta atroalba]|nr:hypothetical protein [Lignoscripta atroalba]
MEDLPPSYDDAMSRNPWTIIGPYLPRRDLLAVCLVNREAYQGASKALWGDPSRYWGYCTEDINKAFDKFKKCVDSARFDTLWNIHTLDLTVIELSFMIPRHQDPSWLSVLLEKLPNLRCFLANGLSSIDRPVIQSVLKSCDHGLGYGLRLLKMTNMANVGPYHLLCLLQMAPKLTYIDLSFTRAANDLQVLNHLGSLSQSLEVLKLCGIGMNDRSFWELSYHRMASLWSLDIRDNFITEDAILHRLPGHLRAEDNERPPRYQAVVKDPVEVSGADQEQTVRASISAESYLPRRSTRLTHLYIAGNKGLSGRTLNLLLEHPQLEVLDGGFSVALSEKVEVDALSFPGSPKGHLQYLRTNHMLVTGNMMWHDNDNDNDNDNSVISCKQWPGSSLPSVVHGERIDGPGQAWQYESETMNTRNMLTMGLRTLVLTDVPVVSRKGWLTRALLALINLCVAMEVAGNGTKTTLRTIILELAESTVDQEFNFEEASRSDFSFFDERPNANSDNTLTNPWAGDVVEVLARHKRMSWPQWSGKIKIVYPLAR